MSKSKSQKKESGFLSAVGPAFWTAGTLHLVLALILAFIPLLNLLAYEFCAALSLLTSATAGPVAIGLVRRREARLPWPRLMGLALALNLMVLLPPLTVILLNALRVQNCNMLTGLQFFMILPVAGAALATLWGLALALLFQKRFRAGLCYVALWLGLAVWNAWEAWVGPQMDSYNQLLGWVAGPIYDDVVEPGWPLIFSRLNGLAWSLVLLALCALRPGPRAWARSWALGLLLLAAPVGLGLWHYSAQLEFGRSDSALARVLSATTESEHFIIHHSDSWTDEQAALVARDHEFRYHQIERVLGPTQLPPIHSWVFPSAAQKRRLVGAGRTQYAKPWISSMCLNGSTFPHPTLKHELVHVVAGGFGSWPLAVSAQGGIFMNPGLIEGLAVAVDWSATKFDRHTWSAAMQRIGKAPPVEGLFHTSGFWSAAAGRSYTLAGSFVRYLLDTYGPKLLRQAYGAGSLDGIYPKNTSALLADWQAFLEGLELDQGTLEVARLRFSPRSVFKRTCAHEVAALRSKFGSQLSAKRYQQAEATAREILTHLPQDVRALEMLVEIRTRQDRLGEARAMAEELMEREERGRAAQARLAGRIADLFIKSGEREQARKHLYRLWDAHLGDGSDRLALVKLQALDRGAAGERVLRFLASGQLEAYTMLDLHQAALQEPDWGAAWYLMGRQLFNRGHFQRAIPLLQKARDLGLDHPTLSNENLRLLAISHHRASLSPPEQEPPPGAVPGSMAQAASAWAIITQFPRHRGELLQARDWLERMDFDRKTTLAPATTRP